MEENKKQFWWDELTIEERQKKIDRAKETRKQTLLKKYGVVHISQIPETKEKKKQSSLEKYGVEYPVQSQKVKDKTKETCLEKYGVENCHQHPNVINKTKETCLEKYGVENCHQHPNVINKTKETCLEKYGVESPSQVIFIKEKQKETLINHYGENNPLKVNSIKEKVRKTVLKKSYQTLFDTNRLNNLVVPLFNINEYNGNRNKDKCVIYYKFQCKICENIFEDNIANGRIPRCYKCYPLEKSYIFTKPHKKICKFLDTQNISYEIEKLISPFSVDVFIDPNKIIEIYGDYWHANPKFYKKDEILSFPEKKIIVENEDDARKKFYENASEHMRPYLEIIKIESR